MWDVTRREVIRGGGGAALLAGSITVLGGGPVTSDDTVARGSHVTVRPTETALPDDELLVAPAQLSRWGAVPGQQVRVRRSAEEYAVYTARPAGLSVGTVRMAEGGRARLAASGRFEADVAVSVPHPTYATAAATDHGEYVEELVDGVGSGLVAVAPHGGMIEVGTDRQATRLARAVEGGTAWVGRGWRPGGGAYERWHVPSTALHPASFPALSTVADRGFAHAVSFHGFGGEGVVVGGRAPVGLRREVRDAVERGVDGSLDVRLATGGPYGGTSPTNVVNWLTASGDDGIQLEQSHTARMDHWRAITDAVADVLRERVGIR